MAEKQHQHTQARTRLWRQHNRDVRCRLCGLLVRNHTLRILIDHLTRGGVK